MIQPTPRNMRHESGAAEAFVPVEPAACRLFALCDRAADGTVRLPWNDAVPGCKRCADKLGFTLTPFTV